MSGHGPILLCLATRKGLEVLRAAIQSHSDRPMLVCTFEETGVTESFHDCIEREATRAGLRVVGWKELRDDPLGFIQTYGLAAMLCIGWRYLVPASAIEALGGNVVIAHDSLLPKFRGFAPLVTAMITGETETGVTYLRAGNATDDGDILWQGRITIESDDKIGSLIEKTLPLYRDGAVRYFRGELRQGRPQDESKATYSIWRDSDDYRIDWSQDAKRIERMVRALGPPYLGAQSLLGSRLVTISEAESVKDVPFAIRQPGKIWSKDHDGRPAVVCGNGMLRIRAATVNGKTILPLRNLRMRFK